MCIVICKPALCQNNALGGGGRRGAKEREFLNPSWGRREREEMGVNQTL